MHESIHQHQDDKYPHHVPEEEKLRDENDVADPLRHDVSQDEQIIEPEEYADSEEGIGSRDDGLNLNKDVSEDREDNTEGRLPDIPPSAIIQ